MHHDNLTADELLTHAKDSASQDDRLTSRTYLREYLTRQHALSWLAKVSLDTNEALTAAELALCLNPEDAIAQRAIATVGQQSNATLDRRPERHELSSKIALITGMTLAQARATIWPFENIYRPIGELLDSGRKTLKDLTWAYTVTNKPKLREAVRTILLTHLLGVETEQPPRPLRVVSGSRYTESQERRAAGIAAMLAGAGLMLCALLVIFALASFVIAMPLALRLGVYPLVILVWWSSGEIDRRVKTATAFRAGRWGEERIVEQLRAVLDDRWTLIRNFVYPGRKGGDVDLILVGPGGVWAFEVKAYAGQIRNVGDTWERWIKRGWKRLDVHPGSQARTNAKQLKEFLNDKGLNVRWVEPVVLWASSDAADAEQHGSITLESPQTRVWTIETLTTRIEDLAQGQTKFDAALVTQIVDVLQTTLRAALPSA